MKKLTIEINGEEIGDLLSSLDDIKWRILEDQLSGEGQDASGRYTFEILDSRDIEQDARRHFEATRNAMGFTGPEWEDLGEMTRQVYRKSVTKQLALAECRRKQ